MPGVLLSHTQRAFSCSFEAAVSVVQDLPPSEARSVNEAAVGLALNWKSALHVEVSSIVVPHLLGCLFVFVDLVPFLIPFDFGVAVWLYEHKVLLGLGFLSPFWPFSHGSTALDIRCFLIPHRV